MTDFLQDDWHFRLRMPRYAILDQSRIRFERGDETMSYLSDIAQRMRAYAQRHPYRENYPIGPYQKKLSGGLVLTLIYRELPASAQPEFQLTLARAKVQPSATEIGTCRKFFFIPDTNPAIPFETEDGYQGFRLIWKAGMEAPVEHETAPTPSQEQKTTVPEPPS